MAGLDQGGPEHRPEQVRKLAGLGLTQKDMASFIGCSQSLISRGF
jgi:predicted transcriptional regulator